MAGVEYDDTIEHPDYTGIIEAAVGALAARPRVVTEATARSVVRRAVHHARVRALAEAGDLYAADQVAAELGISARMVRRVAAERGLGTRLGEKTWIFRRADIRELRARAPRGRPPKPGPENA